MVWIVKSQKTFKNVSSKSSGQRYIQHFYNPKTPVVSKSKNVSCFSFIIGIYVCNQLFSGSALRSFLKFFIMSHHFVWKKSDGAQDLIKLSLLQNGSIYLNFNPKSLLAWLYDPLEGFFQKLCGMMGHLSK